MGGLSKEDVSAAIQASAMTLPTKADVVSGGKKGWLASVAEGLFNGSKASKDAPAPEVLGAGMAADAGRTISGRTQQIDRAVDAAVSPKL